MSCNDKDGGTHHYACECREKFYNDDRIRMIRAFQEIQKLIKSVWGDSIPQVVVAIDAICREAIAQKGND